jgi:hypothetical protein
MCHKRQGSGWVCRALLITSVCFTAGVAAGGGYPSDYKPSKPAEKGETNVLARLGAISTYMTDKLNTASGKDSPVCYRNCLTVSFNDLMKCLDVKGTYAASESCEQDAAQKMNACNPKCQ